MEKPNIHIKVPTIAKMSIAIFDSEVIAAKAIAKVRNTHNPWIVQVIKNHQKSFFIRSNLPSLPAFFTLINRKDPRRKAQIQTNKANKTSLKEISTVKRMAKSVTET